MEDVKNLQNHRNALKENTDSFSYDKNRAVSNMSEHIWNWVRKEYPNAKKTKNIIKIMDLADMIFEAQGKKPLFQFGEDIVAWNRPSYWNLNYIKYEIGHKLPVNAGGTSHPENLCYMSARCNQHIQSSLEMHNVLDWYFSHNDEVKNRDEI